MCTCAELCRLLVVVRAHQQPKQRCASISASASHSVLFSFRFSFHFKFAGRQPAWPAYDATNRNILRLDTPIRAQSEAALCNFWDKIGY